MLRKYIQECIESVLNQTLNPYEIIIVDDGSTDMGQNIVKQFSNQWLIHVWHASRGIEQILNSINTY